MLQFLLSRMRRWRMRTVKPFGIMPSDVLRISFGDTNPTVADALANAFSEVAPVEVVAGSLLDLDCDAILSPANSFGDMSGGIDKAIDDFFRGKAQQTLMAAIAQDFCGELPVGMALVVSVSGPRFPFLIAAPTMRIPRSVRGTINAYFSMRAALVAVLRHNQLSEHQIRSLAAPGLGTGVGGIDAIDAAEQMRAAYDNIIGGKWRDVVHGVQAPFVLR